MTRLKDSAVKNAQPKDKDFKMADGGGLYLLVKVSAAKYWRFKYRFNGKEKLLAIGVYPQVSLAEARKKHNKARYLLDENIDPGESKRQQKAQAIIKAENSFKSLAVEWWEVKKGLWTVNHADRVLASLEKDIFPSLGQRPINDITSVELLQTLRKVEARGAFDVVSRLLQRCTKIFQHALITGRTEINPASELGGTLKTRKVKHQASLSRKELPGFLHCMANYDGYALTRLALRFLALTFVRPGELRNARWDEFEIDDRLWRIPAERMKMDSEHIVPLSDQALAVLEELRAISGKYSLLFPGTRNNTQPMSENTLTYAMYRMGYKSRATAHGFRATASSILNEEGFNPDAIERQLAHQERNKVRGAYTHHAEYLKDRRTMMQWWADYLDKLITAYKAPRLTTENGKLDT